jgi:hypothetical protein
MEKLLSNAKKQGGIYANNVTAHAQKNIFFSYGSYKNIFLPTHFLINLIQDELP